MHKATCSALALLCLSTMLLAGRPADSAGANPAGPGDSQATLPAKQSSTTSLTAECSTTSFTAESSPIPIAAQSSTSSTTAESPSPPPAAAETFHLSRDLDLPFDTAKPRVVAALNEIGFPVLTEILLHERFKARLGREIPRTEILGACSASIAAQIYDHDPQAPVLLPCNVVLSDLGQGRTRVSIRNPRGLALADPRFADVGDEVHALMTELLAGL